MLDYLFVVGIILLNFGFWGDSWQFAICEIHIFGLDDFIECDKLKDSLTFKAGDNINLDLDNQTNTVTITAQTVADGNTAQIGSAGVGYEWFANRENATKNNLKDLICGSNMSCSANATDITISSTVTGGANMLNDLTDVTITAPASSEVLQYNGAQWVNAIISATDTNTAQIGSAATSGFEIFANRQNATKNNLKDLICGSNMSCASNSTNISMASTNTAQLANEKNHNNSIIGTRVNATLNNVKTITTANGGTTVSNNSTDIILTNNVKVGNANCAANTFVSVIANTTYGITCSSVSGLPVMLAGNLTTTSTAAFTTVFTIPLTANSGNTVRGVLVAESNTAGAAVQTGARLSAATQTGYCVWETPTTATATVRDVLALSTTTAETGETVWLPAANVPMPIEFYCSSKGGGSPNLLIEFQAEVASTVAIKAGSTYTKTP